ncbi:MAG: glycoside hydrolase family 16 protein [Rhodothermales bacterium]|nr:glycoside hydrolase family 16 protein [Rhodothermales bacterium]
MSKVHLASSAMGVAAVAILSLALSACDRPPEPTRYELVWQDEFEGPAGQSPDSTRWTFDIGTDWGNQQQEYDTDRPENASLDGQGNLAITARVEEYEGQPYTSARMTTAGLFERTYGRFEARIRMPTGAGIWPAFWLLGANLRTVGWPQSGEIDVVEYRGHEPNVIHGTAHGPGHFGPKAPTRTITLESGRFDTDFHVFAVEWGEDYIEWFLDGERYHRITPDDIDGEWVYDHPFYIILNVAVGGLWGGPVGDDTTFPQTMLVDYVRVYSEG